MKDDRHALIKELINERHIATQEELCDLLQQRGQKVTQATVSRDIKAMLLVKTPDGRGGYYYVCPQGAAEQPRQNRVQNMHSSILQVRANDYLVVVHTQPGAANMLGVALDNAKLPQILGTIAGDDTVFIALRSSKDKDKVLLQLKQMQG